MRGRGLSSPTDVVQRGQRSLLEIRVVAERFLRLLLDAPQQRYLCACSLGTEDATLLATHLGLRRLAFHCRSLPSLSFLSYIA